ncbi:MAG TPA: urea transporter, partial [Sulfurovum sp.]|nr:urea transporter [Sulfurovum sp.]
MLKAYTVMFENILKPYSAILFLNHKIAGLIVLAITFLNPSVALSGLVAVISTLLFAKFIEIKDQFLAHGFYIYNSLLVGMGIGYIFELSLKSMALIAISAIFTFVFSFMINRLFSNYKIPILSLPFSIVTMFIYLASLKYSTLYSTLVNHANMF